MKRRVPFFLIFSLILILWAICFGIRTFALHQKENHLIKVNAAGQIPKTPNYILASVNIFSSSTQGSGTIISKGETRSAILTCAHLFKQEIGSSFWIYYPDGTYAKATLLALDRDRDLALGSVDVNTIIGHVFVPLEMTEGVLNGCGYTDGQGPNLRTMSYNETYKNEKGHMMWDLTVATGVFHGGDSGSGLFIGDECLGVAIQRNEGKEEKKMYAVCHNEVVEFLEENKKVLEGCGNWNSKPINVIDEDSPPLWAPKHGFPINSGAISEIRRDIDEIKKRLNFPNMKKPGSIENSEPKDLLKKPSDIK